MSRSGKNTGPGRLRRTASTSPSTRISTSAIRNSWTLTQKLRRSAWAATRRRSAVEERLLDVRPARRVDDDERERRRRRRRRDERDRASARPRRRRPSPNGGPDAARRTDRRRSRRAPSGPWLGRRGRLRAGRPERSPCRTATRCVIASSVPSLFSAAIAALTQAVSGLSLSRTTLKCSARAAGGGELADDDRVVELGAGHVERRRQVDDEAVDLLVLERRDRGVVGVVDLRLLGRGDDVGDRRRGWSCRPGRRT